MLKVSEFMEPLYLIMFLHNVLLPNIEYFIVPCKFVKKDNLTVWELQVSILNKEERTLFFTSLKLWNTKTSSFLATLAFLESYA